MTRFGIAALLAVAMTPLSSGAVMAPLKCLTGTDPVVAGDAAQISTIRSLIDSTCPCASFDGSKGKTHRAYVACAVQVIKTQAAVPPGALRPQCKLTVTSYYMRSTCGRLPASHAAPCITTVLKTGKLSCSIRATTKKDGITAANRCNSSARFHRVACPVYTACIDAADTNHDLLVAAPGDSGNCVSLPLPTSTATATMTITHSPTGTPTITPTATLNTPSSTPTQTAIPTSTPTQTAIPTSTPTDMPTSTPTQTRTVTSTPDVTGPVVVFNTLPSMIGNGQNLTATGTTDPSGVASVTYKYCAGTVCTPTTTIGSSSSGPDYLVSWSAQPADGTYQVSATAVDGFSNSNESATQTVIVDNTAPSSTVSSPAVATIYSSSGTTYAATNNYAGESGWSGSISGTASDSASGVQTVKVSIQQVSSGKYWDGAAFTSTPEVFSTASGTTSWSLTFAASNFPAGGEYKVRPQATDAASHTENASQVSFFVDYDPSHAIFVKPAGSDSNDGLTPSTAKLTIGAAVAIATNTRPLVAIASGTYGGTVNISSGTADPTILRGGYDTNFKRGSVGTNAVTVTGTGGANTTGVLVSTFGAALQQLTINSGTASGAGSSAYGLRAVSTSNVAVANCSISAGAAVGGTNGSTPTGTLTAGSTGANGSDGGNHLIPAGATGGGTGANAGGNGGDGGGTTGMGGANGGTGGSGGCNNCRSNSNYSGAGGAGGMAGANGATGSAGAAGTPAYAATYSPTSAGAGGSGANGGGGGGGGGGGRACDDSLCAGQSTGGGSGAKGGGGGQGGGGGTAGTAAGGSFAVYSFNATVTIDANTTLAAANGATGGNGAIGQTGATGGSGGTGGNGHIADCCTGSPGTGGGGGGQNTNGAGGGDGAAGTCCNGASGGAGGGGGGGKGGTGGTGGGGAGGSSVGMLSKGSGGISFGGSLATQVTIGTAGGGGSASGGNAGTAGTAAKTLVVP